MLDPDTSSTIPLRAQPSAGAAPRTMSPAAPLTPAPDSAVPPPAMTGREKKADIIAAYKKLQEQYEVRALQAKKKEGELEHTRERTLVKEASQHTVESIVQECGSLEQNVHTALAGMQRELEKEAGKLRTIREAIAIEERHLQEVHGIATEANRLADLMETHDAKKEEFEKEMEEKRGEWKREQETYRYTLEQERRREQDEYTRRKEALERELGEREVTVSRREEELKDVTRRAARFDTELNDMVQKTHEETGRRVRAEEKAIADLLAEQTKREREIAEYRITALTEDVASLRAEIVSLKEQLKEANREAKEIAVKVIEGASDRRAREEVSRIAMRQAQGVAGRE